MKRKNKNELSTNNTTKGDTTKSLKTFEELTKEEIGDIIFYETFVARSLGHYITHFNEKDIRKKYQGCTFPYYTLNMMRLIHKNEKINQTL